MTSGVPSLRPAHRCDGQRPVVLPWFVGTRTEERVDALVEDVVESVDVDFSVDIVERHLWRNTALFWKHKQEMAGGGEKEKHVGVFLWSHLSVLKVHEYPDLTRSEAYLDVCGGLSAKSVLVPEKEKTRREETRRKI